MARKSRPSRNDQRSNAKNPNNAAYRASTDNRSRQLNPEHRAHDQGPVEGAGAASEKSAKPS